MLVLKCRYGRTKSQLSSLQLVTPSGKNATSLAEVSWRSNEKKCGHENPEKNKWGYQLYTYKVMFSQSSWDTIDIVRRENYILKWYIIPLRVAW